MNMSYCRHENTLRDLQDVFYRWDDSDPVEASVDERRARAALVELCAEVASLHACSGTVDGEPCGDCT